MLVATLLTACANGDSAGGSGESQTAGQAAAPLAATPAAGDTSAPMAAVDSSVSTGIAASDPAATPGSSGAPPENVSGAFTDVVRAAVRERFPSAASTRIAEVRSQRWGEKHLVVSFSNAADGSSIIGVHVFDGDFKLLRTLDVFVGDSGSWPVVRRVAADSVVVQMVPEKGDPAPKDRKAYEWQSIEGQ